MLPSSPVADGEAMVAQALEQQTNVTAARRLRDPNDDTPPSGMAVLLPKMISPPLCAVTVLGRWLKMTCVPLGCYNRGKFPANHCMRTQSATFLQMQCNVQPLAIFVNIMETVNRKQQLHSAPHDSAMVAPAAPSMRIIAVSWIMKK